MADNTSQQMKFVIPTDSWLDAIEPSKGLSHSVIGALKVWTGTAGHIFLCSIVANEEMTIIPGMPPKSILFREQGDKVFHAKIQTHQMNLTIQFQ
jgi:hypothetical protein